MTVHRVQVQGGTLAVEELSGTSEPVLVVHGVSSQRALWTRLHAGAPDLTLVAPDLRGRGDSVDVAGPSSMAQHAQDLVAVLDHLGLDRVHVYGMSMGGFVSVELAARYPDRVRSLTLVDGGVPAVPPNGLTRETVSAVFADKVERSRQTRASVDEYVDFVVSSSAPLLDRSDPLLHIYAAHDLHEGVVRLDGNTVVSDAEDVFFGISNFADVRAPISLLYAQWSVGADSAPMYTAEYLSQYTFEPSTRLDGHDHAAMIMTGSGAAATAKVLRAAISQPSSR
ncbi:Alpha/beta hydrolase fold protein [Rhodococcus sp. AW25M09]|uniref:alpha/beta fold hydrolase n=1 Tax=Rhodococcus sp. AW25M09 TaxID=1268303 RepID=UPI0002AC40BA|nr:alpha/beta fold hydrolase [Rhodococcus sp. AW25M09]CCQ14057.1 Alpha/beta hydrolase fold protein [Rhodococcus sp. AW25M09]